MTSGGTITRKTQNKNHLRTCHRQLLTDAWQTKKGLTKLISLNSVRPFCWFHTYYLITTGYLINNTKISSVIILLSNRTLMSLKRPVYAGSQIFFIIQTPLRTAFHDTQRLLLEAYSSNICSDAVLFAPLMKK